MRELLSFPGTRRTRAPEQTLELITDRFGDYGITRLADVTDLDDLGIPIVMSIRPQGLTVAVSQGKGLSLTLAKVSAAMEAMELWHVEHAVPKPELTDAPAGGLSLPYDIAAMEQHAGGLLTADSRLDWIAAENLVAGGATLLPRGAVEFGPTYPQWQPAQLIASSNGLASGNTLEEATVHAMYELIERDCADALTDLPPARRRIIDPESVTDPRCRDLLDRIRQAGCWFEIVDGTADRWRPVHCFSFHLWRPDSIITATGCGAHRDPAIALSRAITEAAQARLTAITGSRDDISPRVYHAPIPRPPAQGRTMTAWSQAVEPADAATAMATDVAEADWLTAKLYAVTGHPPMRVDLTQPSETDIFN
ncbi:MAG: YcaO-like family protein, partial [Stackebrandtia sp.]